MPVTHGVTGSSPVRTAFLWSKIKKSPEVQHFGTFFFSNPAPKSSGTGSSRKFAGILFNVIIQSHATPLPPFRNLLFIRDSGWNPLFTSPMTHLSFPNLTPQLLKCLWFAGQMPVVKRVEVWGLGSWDVSLGLPGCVVCDMGSTRYPV